MRGPRNTYKPKGGIISQRRSKIRTYDPSAIDLSGTSELQAPHPSAPIGKNLNYVVSMYDAMPINAARFMTQSGTNPADIGWDGQAGPYQSSSAFFIVPAGRLAILRDFQLIIVPSQGETIAEGQPIIATNGTSNFLVRLDFFVNGTAQQGLSNIITWAAAFGDIFGNTYCIGQEGDIIEARVTNANGGSSTWSQALFALNGDLLISRGYPSQYEPGTDAVIPVKKVEDQ